jgi:hypothetical protein
MIIIARRRLKLNSNLQPAEQPVIKQVLRVLTCNEHVLTAAKMDDHSHAANALCRRLSALRPPVGHGRQRDDRLPDVVAKLRAMKLAKAASVVAEGVGETLSYMAYPREHWTRIRTNNPLERIMREIRRRTRVVGAFPDGHSALMLVATRLRNVAGTKWGTRKYLDMERLADGRDANVDFCGAQQTGESNGTRRVS